jgi:uncharacterized protein (DUF934 family)
MRQIIRQREIVADSWRYPGEQGAGPAVLTLADFLAALPAGPAPRRNVGVRIAPTDEVELLGPHLADVALIVVDFPKNGDGRGFTQAQILRQRYRYGGELRAAGVIQRDHMFHLARCGFDAFDLAAGESLPGALAALHAFSVAYQGASDAGIRTDGRRHG